MQKIDKIGKKMRQVGKTMTLGLTLPIIGLGAASIHASDTFRQSMAQVATLIPGNTARIEELSSSVKSLAIETGKSTSDISGGLYQTISAFGDSAETVDRLTIALRAGTAGAADTQSTLSMLSGVTKAYGDTSATALQRVSDLAFKTVELGETTFPELASEMGKVNSIAAKMGVTQEEVFATFAAGTGPLGNTADVATKLKGAMVAMLKPTKDMEIAFKKLGVKNGEQLIQQKGLQGSLFALTDLAKKFDVPLAKLFGRSEALQLAFSLTGNQADDFSKKLVKVTDASGSTAKAYLEMTKGINENGFTMRQFKQLVNVLAIDIGDRLAPVLAKLLRKIWPMIEGFLNLSDKAKGIILVIAGVVAAIGPLILVIGGLIGAVTQVVVAVKAVSTALMFLAANPVGIIIMAIGALIVITILLIKNWDKVKNFFMKIWGFISKIFKSKIGLIITALFPFIGIPLTIAANWEKVVAVFKKVFAWGGKVVGKVRSLIGLSGNEEKFGLVDSQGNPIPSTAREKAAIASNAKATMVENNTKIKIENKSDAKVRTEVDSGNVDLETFTGELIPATG